MISPFAAWFRGGFHPADVFGFGSRADVRRVLLVGNAVAGDFAGWLNHLRIVRRYFASHLSYEVITNTNMLRDSNVAHLGAVFMLQRMFNRLAFVAGSIWFIVPDDSIDSLFPLPANQTTTVLKLRHFIRLRLPCHHAITQCVVIPTAANFGRSFGNLFERRHVGGCFVFYVHRSDHRYSA